MEVYCRGVAKIRHVETGVVYDIDCNELDWDAVGGDDREMGLETHHEAMTWRFDGIPEYPAKMTR